MATHRVTPPWHYLHEASERSLQSFELSRLNHAANLRKEIAVLLEQWIEELAEAMVARWVREDRRKSPPCGEPVNTPAQAELPLFLARMVDIGPRQSVRRLRPRIRSGEPE